LFSALSTIAPPPITVAAVNILEIIELDGLVDGAVVGTGVVFLGKFGAGRADAVIVAGVVFLNTAGAGAAGAVIVADVVFLAKAGAGSAGAVIVADVVFLAKAGAGSAGAVIVVGVVFLASGGIGAAGGTLCGDTLAPAAGSVAGFVCSSLSDDNTPVSSPTISLIVIVVGGTTLGGETYCCKLAGNDDNGISSVGDIPDDDCLNC